MTVGFAHVWKFSSDGRWRHGEILVEGDRVWKFLVIQKVFVVVKVGAFQVLPVVSILLLLLLPLLLHCEACFRIGRNRRYTCFVIQPRRHAATVGRLSSVVTIGDVTAVVGLSCRGLLLLLLLLNRLQGIALVNSGYPVVTPFVEHLPYLSGSERRRQIATTAVGGGARCRRVATDGGGTDCAAAAGTVLVASYHRRRFGRGR